MKNLFNASIDLENEDEIFDIYDDDEFYDDDDWQPGDAPWNAPGMSPSDFI